MRERRAPDPDETPAARGPRATARVLSALLSTAAVGIGAWFALRRRRPALPAFADEARPASPVRSGLRSTAAPSPVPPSHVPTSPVQTPPAPTAAARPDTVPTEEPVPGTPRRRSGSSGVPVTPQGESLLAVSGIGRRSAAALSAAGITDLRALAEADTDALARALEGAGLRRSPTLASWPTQARRLIEG